MSKDLISVIIPVFNEQNHISNSIDIIRTELLKINIQFEFIIVDDGSRDNTWSILKELSKDINDIYAIKLSRNFGKEAALCSGLEIARGNACLVMDADLQHPPKLIHHMIEKWKYEGYDVVEAVKSHRGKESFVNKVGASIFYTLLERLSGFKLYGASDYKLLDRKVVDAWKELPERDTFFRGMSAWVGFNRASLSFEVASRTEGKSKWSILHLVKLAVTAITSFSTLPLQIVTFMGTLFLIGSFILGIQTLFMKFSGIAVTGFTTVILLLLIIGSTLMISLGIIGTYIARIYNEVKARPRYVIKETIESKKNDL